MAAIKAKPIRLIDLLNSINQEEYVLITFNNGRSTYSNSVGRAEIDFKPDLGKEIKGITVRSGTLNIFI